ncbi:hypothetical protein B0T26DRAFT_654501 [Lasiosphaeria miniovina]|uniref:Gag1-like clamp domain-containing protein n=1 Tax=Lasiosphaeria miniovina TaxID=1954250 RepID=A0AA40DMB4_9PEZI|nr:uncharacterized protein B0T26DRAFT_654501 [Lasiosphaeria miniovina]KAK0708979.1 hypothetical protein B0T26DRAFT_654501 [Lasiosphaeria miniovina]
MRRSLTCAASCVPSPGHPGPTEPGQDIIPLPFGQATPHCEQALAPAPLAHIKSAPSSELPVREVDGGDRELSPIDILTHLKIPSPKMIFSELYKSPRLPFSKLRASHPQPVAVPDVDADLVSRDKVKQKEAVRRFLAEKIRCDWDFVWPSVLPSYPRTSGSTVTASDHIPRAPESDLHAAPAAPAHPPVFDQDAPRDAGDDADSESDAESVYSIISEDALHFSSRIEWTSDLSDDEIPVSSGSPFRFDSPEAVGTAIQSSIITRQTLHRRAVREEAAWNLGLACFEARRNAWTGARTVRVRPKPPTPISPSSPRRLFRRHHRSESAPVNNMAPSPPASTSPLSPSTTRTSQQLDIMAITPPPSESDSAHSASLSKTSTGTGVQRTSSQESAPDALYPVETLVPIPPPLLPPQNPMRTSITSSIYPSLYDKIVVHSLQPSCPVNLSDMMRACVVGWKRDGEWPPKMAIQAVPTPSELAAIRRRKAQQQKQQHARKGSTATLGSSRRLSFGFLSGNKSEKIADDKDREEGKENNSDEAPGKGIRRSLQKVFSFGQHGHVDANGSAVLSPTTVVLSPTLSAAL